LFVLQHSPMWVYCWIHTDCTYQLDDVKWILNGLLLWCFSTESSTIHGCFYPNRAILSPNIQKKHPSEMNVDLADGFGWFSWIFHHAERVTWVFHHCRAFSVLFLVRNALVVLCPLFPGASAKATSVDKKMLRLVFGWFIVV
jgi:hypothetical protein